MNWKEIINKKEEEVRAVRDAEKFNDEQAKKNEADRKTEEKNGKIAQLLSTWDTEILPNFEILNKCGIEEFLKEINRVSFGGKGEMSVDPKNKNDYYVRKYHLYPGNLYDLSEGETYHYRTCGCTTLSANYIGYKKAGTSFSAGEWDGYPEDVCINKIRISVEVCGENTDKKIVLSYNNVDFDDDNRSSIKNLPLPNLANQDEIDQFKEKLAEELATLMANDPSYPFTELREDAMQMLKKKGDADYIKRNILNNHVLSKLTNGDKIRVAGMKEREINEAKKGRGWF